MFGIQMWVRLNSAQLSSAFSLKSRKTKNRTGSLVLKLPFGIYLRLILRSIAL